MTTADKAKQRVAESLLLKIDACDRLLDKTKQLDSYEKVLRQDFYCWHALKTSYYVPKWHHYLVVYIGKVERMSRRRVSDTFINLYFYLCPQRA